MLLDNERVRGVGYAPVERSYRYKIRIPKGWHHNILDPTVDSADGNRHEALPDFTPSDLDSFFFLTAKLWNVSVPRGGQLL